MVTYTVVSCLFEDGSDIGSPGADGPPIMPEDPYAYIMAAYQVPPSPDYIPGPEEPQSPPPLDFVPEPMYPEYIPQEDEILPAEEQPLPAAASPTADSPGYVPESDPEEDDEDPEEDPADYPADRDDDDDEDEDEDEEEEEEHPALADSVPPIPSPTITYTITTANHSPTHIEIPESCLPLRKRVHFASPTPSHEVGESSAAGAARQDGPAVAREDPYSLDYGITDTWDDLVGAIDEIAPTTLEGVNQRVTDLSTIVEQETTIMYGIMEDAQDDRSQLRGRVNLLYRDRRFYVMSLRTTVVAQSALISELQSSDHRRQRDYRHRWSSFRGSMDPQKVRHSLMHQERLVAAPRFGYVVAMLCSVKKWNQREDHKVKPKYNTNTSHRIITILTVTNAQIQAMINEGITAALAARDATRNGNDSHTSGTGVRRPVQVKFATCTLQGNALTWWNSYVKTTTPEAAHAMPWRTLKKMMIDKYCPRGEIKKLEFKMWNLKVKGTDVVTYSQRFQELALMCDRMFLEEIDKVERYVSGLPDTIHGSGYQQKDRKPSQNDKTEHGMEKTVQNQGQSPEMSKSESILKNQQSNREHGLKNTYLE
ncbi:reverse transcriptase domain-containing protein [Tanacetum coccineum]